ncbi:MAG: TRAP transporter small permease [Desulfotignum sp.]|nr:TRAP transporter small permease [Desulfotignum sp.]MCF8125030.1 TRAP transporter small permease [Desulfotignum sp.]
MRNFVNILGLFSYFLSRLGCVALFAMMCLTVVDVVGRYVFNSPILGAFEITEFMVLVMVFSFLGYAQAQKAHVTVDIVYDKFPANARRIIAIANYIISFIVMLIVCWMGFEKAVETWQTGEKPLNLAVLNYPFVFFLSFGAMVMCIEYIRDVIRKLQQKGDRK